MHAYKQDGTPAYKVKMKTKDGLRDTNIKDCRELNLVPSVTEIEKVAAAPALTNWLIQQAYLAMATMPEIEGETIDDRIKRAKKDAAEQANEARDKGIAIHDALECYFTNGEVIAPYGDYIEGVINKLGEMFGPQEWIAEKYFASPLGYGGKADLHCPIAVVDFKTKEFVIEEGKKPKKMAYDNHGRQLSAYRAGLGIPEARMVNLFISTSEPGLVVAEEHEKDHLDEFLCLLKFWQLIKGYDSSFSDEA